MEKDSTSFWADIKKYEDILAKDPKSYCFAPLSELYRKLGLLDDAVGVAKQGTDLHPEYIGGFMALGRALFEKGDRELAKASLEKVALATPENLLAQKILSQIYQEEGNLSAAERALQLLVTFNPEDTESTIALEVLTRSMASLEVTDPVSSADANLTDDLEGETFSEDVFPGDLEGPSISALSDDTRIDTDSEYFDLTQLSDNDSTAEGEFFVDDSTILPLPTVTLAELFEAQGLYDRALDVYADLLSKDPDNQLLKERFDALSLRFESKSDLMSTSGLCESTELSATGTSQDAFAPDVSRECLGNSSAGVLDREGMVVVLLEQWLDSIRRRKECR
jgi:tetratricopeptide (TPR) repeat protein